MSSKGGGLSEALLARSCASSNGAFGIVTRGGSRLRNHRIWRDGSSSSRCSHDWIVRTDGVARTSVDAIAVAALGWSTFATATTPR